MTKKTGFALVLLITEMQVFYAAYAYIDPLAFSTLRGTDLVSVGDADWVRIYASRTLFVSLVIGLLLYLRNFTALYWVAIFGIVMPATDTWLAYNAGASYGIMFKHVATVAYLLLTAAIIKRLCPNKAEQ